MKKLKRRQKPILLLYPPFEGKNYLVSRAPFPIGLLYIAAYLKKKGISVEVVDMSYPPKKEYTLKPPQLSIKQMNYFRFGWTNIKIKKWLKKNLKKYHHIIGISSLMSSNWTGAYRLINLIKYIDPSKEIIIGGPHATTSPFHVFKNCKADYICIGEGEESFYKFLRDGYAFGIVSRKTTIIEGSQRNFIKKMDELPFPKRNLLKDNRKIREIYITFSRGCPHKCSFCSSHLIQGRKWRHKSVERCIKEIKFYQKNWEIKNFVIEDDNPCPGIKGEKHLRELCRQIISNKIKAKFSVSHGIPVYITAKKENCELLYNAGFRKMVFPLESTNKEVLKDMNKEFTPNNWRKAIKNWNYEKKHPTEIILGYPFVETIESMLETMLEIAENECLIWASHFRLYKGTSLFSRCLKAGYIDEKYDPINTQGFYISTERFGIKELKQLIQISRGLNYFVEKNYNIYNSPFDIFKKTSKPGIIAKGNFKFRRSQNIAAKILLCQTGKFTGEPYVTYNGNDKLILKGENRNIVYNKLNKIFKERRNG